jgi:prophage antirepressor-like protein
MKDLNHIKQFHSDEFGVLDILMIGGKPYFPASECAAVLGYKNPRKAIIDHCKGVTKRDSLSGGGMQTRNFIPEGDLYRLIARSKLPAAERFETWVFDEVLPAIREHGAYAAYGRPDGLPYNPEPVARLVNRLEEERRRNRILIKLAADMMPKAAYCERVLGSRKAIPVSLIAKDYGMAAASFNNLLHGLGIQYKVSGTWLLYQKYAGRGYTKSLTYRFGENAAAVHTCWTQKGRLFLYGFLKKSGILPLYESMHIGTLSN